jgi:Sigma-70, region 4
MPPIKAVIELGEAVLSSPVVKEAAESAIKAGAHLLEEFFTTGAKSAARAAIGGVEKTAHSRAASGLANSIESLLKNPRNDQAVTSLISHIESPLQSAASRSAEKLGMPLTESHKTAITELAQDGVLTSRLQLISGDLKPASVLDFQKHLQRSVTTDFKTTFGSFLKSSEETAAENAGLLRGSATHPFDAVVAGDRMRIVESAMQSLTPRRAEAIQQRFYENLPRSLAGQNMGITSSGVEQLEGSALRSLKRTVTQSMRPEKNYRQTPLYGNKPFNWEELL